MWISVGTAETDENVTHGALYQKVSQIDSCKRLAQAWGETARFSVFEGGHDPVKWAQELPAAVRWALE
jgi:hypothetical protein